MNSIPMSFCTPIWATLDPVETAAQAIAINPANDPAWEAPLQGDHSPERLAVLTGSVWPTGTTIRVGFPKNTTADVVARVLSMFREWSKTGNIDFDEAQSDLDFLVDFNLSGFWSYLGPACKQFAANGKPSMSLQGFDRYMPDSEWMRVVPHEGGHGIGLPHEHLAPEIRRRLSPPACYRRFGSPPNSWSRLVIDKQILNPDPMPDWWQVSPPDDRGVMCYGFDADLTIDGIAIPGGMGLTDRDRASIAIIYPGRVPSVIPPIKPPVVPPKPDTLRLDVNGAGLRSVAPAGGSVAYRFTHNGKGRLAVTVILRGVDKLSPIATLGQVGGQTTMLKFDGEIAGHIKAVAGEYELTVRHPVPSAPVLCWVKVERK